MAKKEDTMTLEDFFQKVENEGGIEDAIAYGLDPAKYLSKEDLAKYPEFATLWEAASQALDKLGEYIGENFDDIRYGE